MDNVPIETLKEWDKNPRDISKDGFERLKKQITKLGIYKPLIVVKEIDKDSYIVLGGNMRLRAYRDLGLTSIPITIIDAPTEEKKIEYALSDNDRAGQYEGDQLADLIGNFPDVEWNDYAVDIKPPLLVHDLMDQYSEIVEDEVPEVPTEAISKYGEVYQLGRHRLGCLDATKIEDVEKLMDGKKADMVFTDPPYGMDLDTDYSGMKSKPKFAQEKGVKSGKEYGKVIGDDKPFSYQPFEWIDCKEQFWWGGDYYIRTLPENGSWFVWDKRVEENMDRMFGSTFEMVWSKQKHKREIVRIKWAGIFGTEQERGSNRVHPTQKPIQLASWFYKKFSPDNGIIMDLFGGSGSFLIACEQTNRICYMMEIDPKYCDVIRKRYENFISQNSKGAVNGKSASAS